MSQDPAAPVLFADTFTSHVEPEIGVAAFEILAAAGPPPRLVPHVCCGRPLISQGLLSDAPVKRGFGSPDMLPPE